jgi:hypothetical protein
VVLAVGIGSVLGLAGLWWSALGSDPSQHRPAAGPPRHHVEYRVGGTAKAADLLYIAPGGELAQRAHVPLPLGGAGGDPVITLDVPSGSYVSISAQGTDPGAASVSCELSVDGTRLVERQASGHFAVVDCSGVVP